MPTTDYDRTTQLFIFQQASILRQLNQDHPLLRFMGSIGESAKREFAAQFAGDVPENEDPDPKINYLKALDDAIAEAIDAKETVADDEAVLEETDA